MVNGSNTVDRLGVVFCPFQQPQRADKSKTQRVIKLEGFGQTQSGNTAPVSAGFTPSFTWSIVYLTHLSGIT